jgi:hypothetical protein
MTPLKKFTLILGLCGAVFLPFSVFAAGPNLFGVVVTVGNLLLIAVQVIGSLALLYFLWGLANYVLNAGDEKKKEEGRNIMLWGTIALFVMVSVWGLVRALQETFDIDSDVQLGTPQVTVE